MRSCVDDASGSLKACANVHREENRVRIIQTDTIRVVIAEHAEVAAAMVCLKASYQNMN